MRIYRNSIVSTSAIIEFKRMQTGVYREIPRRLWHWRQREEDYDEASVGTWAILHSLRALLSIIFRDSLQPRRLRVKGRTRTGIHRQHTVGHGWNDPDQKSKRLPKPGFEPGIFRFAKSVPAILLNGRTFSVPS